ncbi:SAM-dependent methyltransferase [Streptomyces sp. ICBB 8177]|uniref:SAM-dependent methyltransferase n=1 Tax=Streptomyces sp. ICBB 8177 TaxID=563922 RepID=UPI000D67FE05|nr:SAM-dependent methyltransferase [Streptomyces sp. ICBB 8177]PWI42924.1 SAM-dependent methyltransferase [Streptomyces sp. ICBB 8177]
MSTPAQYFAEMYRDSDDPWRLAERWYERRKYALTMAALPRERYRDAFEPACSVGVLTRLLADRCDRLLSCDRVPRAVDAARRRVAGLAHATVEQRVLPAQWPTDRRFDLVVLSEMLYYFSPDEERTLLDQATASLEPQGTLVAVHWRHPVDDHAQTGDEAHRVLRSVPGLARVAAHEEPDFLLEVFARSSRPGADPRSLSVAALEGLV